MKILLAIPPLLQPNTPYAATPLLAAWLKQVGHDVVQADFSLELLLRLFSEEGIDLLKRERALPAAVGMAYRETIKEVVALLQDRIPDASRRIARRGYLPEGPNVARAYAQEEQLGWNFRGLKTSDHARHLASLFLGDIADAARKVDPNFGFSRYAESLSARVQDFSILRTALEEGGSFFFQWLDELVDRQMELHRPELVALTVPFPGCLLGALAIARRIRQTHPGIHTVLGGGYVGTELRDMKDPRIFDYVDSIVLDSGLIPLQRLAERAETERLVRTMRRVDGEVRLFDCAEDEPTHRELPAPDYQGLHLDCYFGLFEMLNPVTRLWSDGRWNKLVLAHGCCWSRCTFCDTSLDYIRRYDPADPWTICNWIETVLRRTDFNGFHFVDEALPPDLIDGLCDEILRRDLRIEWWGNIRFEKRFSTVLIDKMVAAGCIAATGGLETCCDRTLKLMQKGITVEHAVRVLGDLSAAGIMTHSYLMYGFPTQTLKETLQALETVRDLFDSGALYSAYWHRFALTAHSAIAQHPQNYGIEPIPLPSTSFAVNEIPFNVRFDHDLDMVGRMLKTATYNYQLGIGLDFPIEKWMETIKRQGFSNGGA